MTRPLSLALALASLTFLLAAPADAQRRRGRSAAEEAESGGGHAFDPGDRWGLADEAVRGPSDALVTIIEFSDFECPFCARVTPTLERVLADPDFGSDVRLVFLHTPLPFHQNADEAAEAAIEAHLQGRFWEFHDALFERSATLSEAAILDAADEVGLDVDAVRAALDAGTHEARVQAHQDVATSVGISGTPIFLINGRRLPGAQPFEAFAGVVREERTAMQDLIDGGMDRATAYATRLDINLATVPPEQETVPERPSIDETARVYIDLDGLPVRGNADAPVTIVEFSDFECPFCQRVQGTLTELMALYPDEVRVVFVHNPLPFHQNADGAARAAIAAANQGRFWEFHDMMFRNIRALELSALEAIAEALELDVEQWREDVDAAETAALVEAQMQQARDVYVRGTPQFFVNGSRILGAQPLDVFVEAVETALTEARETMDGGVDAADVYDTVLADAPRVLVPE